MKRKGFFTVKTPYELIHPSDVKTIYSHFFSPFYTEDNGNQFSWVENSLLTSSPMYRVKMFPKRSSFSQLRPFGVYLATSAQVLRIKVAKNSQHYLRRKVSNIGGLHQFFSFWNMVIYLELYFYYYTFILSFHFISTVSAHSDLQHINHTSAHSRIWLFVPPSHLSIHQRDNDKSEQKPVQQALTLLKCNHKTHVTEVMAEKNCY